MAYRQSIGIREVLISVLPQRLFTRFATEAGVGQRRRKVRAHALFWTLVLGFGTGRERTVAGLPWHAQERQGAGRTHLDSLRPILERSMAKVGGTGLLFRPTTARGGRPAKPPTYIQEHTMKRQMEEALRSCRLKRMTWYETTRHTFASQWVLEGKPIGRLARMLGHTETEVTERYADLFPAEERLALAIDLDGHTAKNGYRMITTRTQRILGEAKANRQVN